MILPKIVMLITQYYEFVDRAEINMENVTNEEKEYAFQINLLRISKDFEKAINLCNIAIERYPDNNFFYKIKGDILFAKNEYKESLRCYDAYLDKIKNAPQYFANFARFLKKVSQKTIIDKALFEKLLKISRTLSYNMVVRNGALKLISDYWIPSNETIILIERVNHNFTEQSVKQAFLQLERQGKCELVFFLNRLNITNCVKETDKINRLILKNLEDQQMYDIAISWVQKILSYSNDGVIIRSLFRICRLRNDYTEAIEYMKQNDVTDRHDFNIQYELVLFYDTLGDEVNRNNTLKNIEMLYSNSRPIANTLFKFYLQFDMLEQAKRIEKILNDLINATKSNKKQRRRNKEILQENQDIIWDHLYNLHEEQEHNRRLLAITELVRGFSHELGQPITNIRYAIQLFFLKQKKENVTIPLQEKELLDGIILQTSRVGKLLNRFAPIVSSKNQEQIFNVYDEIVSTFEDFNMRLKNSNTTYKLIGDKNAKLYGDTVQFSQIFYNLIINALYAINKKGCEGKIDVRIDSLQDKLIIYFSDNGIGISKENYFKIFEPFYSTKQKDVEEGGEGLGLYIVWNILKKFKGRIYVNPTYQSGAMFVMEFNKEVKKNV